ncbi:unnamed protein product [Peronospora belbahrii]|nr:unnamed protein product [Peronospora belbahrii]
MDDHRNSCVSHVDSIDRDGKPYPTADCAVYYDDYSNFNPLSSSMSSVMTTNSTEDLAMSQRQRQYSFNSRIQRRSTEVVPSRNAFRTSSTAASAGFLMAKKKAMTAVVMRGWMQKRKGLVLKRWKKYYCLWKSDDSLCLYASEDTVNGRLEERYQVLRVVLTDKNNSFHIIGVDSGNAPRRVEFRVTISTEWIRWFQVLKKLLDKSSMEQALLSEPGVVFAKPYNKAEDDSCIDYNCESDALTNAKHIKSHDGRHSYSTQSKQLTTVSCAFYGAKRNEKLSTLFSGLSALSINARSQTCKELIPFQMKFGVETRDCQMIECSNEETVPILEIRGSESNTADYLQVLPPS